MHKRRSSQPPDLYDATTAFPSASLHQDRHQADRSGSCGSAHHPSSSHPSSPLQRRRSSPSSKTSPKYARRPSRQVGTVRASSSAVGIDFDFDTHDDEVCVQDRQPLYPPPDAPSGRYRSAARPSAAMPSSASSHVLPFSLSRPGRSRVSLTMLLLLAFLSAVFLFSLFPASRHRGKAAVDSIGSYAGHVWDDWKTASLTGGLNRGSNRIRERPRLHEDPTKTTRCTASFDGKRNVVQYAIMIDAGSTGSRVHVYKFNYCNALPELEDEVFQMLRPGLSSFRGDPKAAADSLRPLLTTSLAAIPKSLQSCTPIAVKATAGLRLLGATDSKAILHAVRQMLKDEYPFQLADGKTGVAEVTHGANNDEGRAVEIMEGKDEGVFAWITVNYLLGLIGPPLPGENGVKRRRTAAVMDLGGASTQIVFEPNQETGSQGMHPGEHVYELRDFGGRDYTLYQNSYLGYGLMQARKSINSLTAYAYSYSHSDVALTGQLSSSPNELEIPSPCFAMGKDKMTAIAKIGAKNEEIQVKFKGTTGGFKACKRLVEVMMDKDAVCSTMPCSFAGVYQPSLMSTFRSGAPIVALSYFYDRLAPLGFSSSSDAASSSSSSLPPGFTIPQLAGLAEDVCRSPESWPARFPADRYPGALQELLDRPESCLDLTYLHSLLSLGYELEDKDGMGRPGDGDLRVRIEKKLAGTELGWALGAAVGMVGEVEGCWIR